MRRVTPGTTPACTIRSDMARRSDPWQSQRRPVLKEGCGTFRRTHCNAVCTFDDECEGTPEEAALREPFLRTFCRG